MLRMTERASSVVKAGLRPRRASALVPMDTRLVSQCNRGVVPSRCPPATAVVGELQKSASSACALPAGLAAGLHGEMSWWHWVSVARNHHTSVVHLPYTASPSCEPYAAGLIVQLPAGFRCHLQSACCGQAVYVFRGLRPPNNGSLAPKCRS